MGIFGRSHANKIKISSLDIKAPDMFLNYDLVSSTPDCNEIDPVSYMLLEVSVPCDELFIYL